MEFLLDSVTKQALNYAIRSGIGLTATYALHQSTKLLKTVEGHEKNELQLLQRSLESKIRIISPAIDMIELISARGNTTLESAVSLTKQLRWDIQEIGRRLEAAAMQESLRDSGSSRAHSEAKSVLNLKQIVADMKLLLTHIEDAVPLINLAITTSGASLSTTLPVTISPSRLLQASTFLTAGDTHYSLLGSSTVQIGPTFTLSLYMLFAGHARPESEDEIRASIWKEVMHKARVKLVRVSLDAVHDLPRANSFDISHPHSERHNNGNMRGENMVHEYAYQLVIVEDLDDDRMHTFDSNELQPCQYDDVEQAGIREALPVYEISKIFYADTGKILNIGADDGGHHPVLLLKRDINAISPRRMMKAENDDSDLTTRQPHPVLPTKPLPVKDPVQAQIDEQIHSESRRSSSVPIVTVPELTNVWRLPANLDPEWLAFEVYTEAEDPDEESGDEKTKSSTSPVSGLPSPESYVPSALSRVDLHNNSSAENVNSLLPQNYEAVSPAKTSMHEKAPWMPAQFQQTSHLSISDEFLNFFLSEAATTGAADGDEHQRRVLREEARRRVGFDPYDESPVKRRGEDYQYRRGTSPPDWQGNESDMSNDLDARSGAQQHVFQSIEHDFSQLDVSRRSSSIMQSGGSKHYDSGYASRRLTSSMSPASRPTSAKRITKPADLPPPSNRNLRQSTSHVPVQGPKSGPVSSPHPSESSRSCDRIETPDVPSPATRGYPAIERVQRIRGDGNHYEGSPLARLP